MDIVIRDLCENDHEQIFPLLQHLTNAPFLSRNTFKQFLDEKPSCCYMKVAVHDQKIVGMATLLIENKLIHGGAKVGHIEDVVVHPGSGKKGVGSFLIQELLKIASTQKAYKVVLHCKRELVPFYAKNGFHESSVGMRIDLKKLTE